MFVCSIGMSLKKFLQRNPVFGCWSFFIGGQKTVWKFILVVVAVVAAVVVTVVVAAAAVVAVVAAADVVVDVGAVVVVDAVVVVAVVVSYFYGQPGRLSLICQNVRTVGTWIFHLITGVAALAENANELRKIIITLLIIFDLLRFNLSPNLLR